MKKDNNTMYIKIAIALVAFILVGSIAYASFTQQLDIQGKATVQKSSWSIKFTNLQPVVKTGTATEVTAPTINTNDTKISEYDVTLTTPGDSVTYNFDVTNEGTFNAKISSITIPTPTCTGTGTNASTDETNVCDNLTYKLTYADGSPIAVDDTLDSGETKSLKLSLTYSSSVSAAQLPSNDVAVSNLAISIIYAQSADNSAE